MEDTMEMELSKQFKNRRIKDDARAIASAIMKKHCRTADTWSRGEIVLNMISRGYLTEEELQERREEYLADLREFGDYDDLEDEDEEFGEDEEDDPDGDEEDTIEEEEPEEFFCEEMNWTISCSVTIELDDNIITRVVQEDRVWGDDGLGDFFPGDVYTIDEMEMINNVTMEVLQAITIPEENAGE